MCYPIGIEYVFCEIQSGNAISWEIKTAIETKVCCNQVKQIIALLKDEPEAQSK